jgi:cytoskeleton protein RodZ
MLETLGIGPSLREARIHRGIGLDRVQADTRIRVRYLEAIEDDRWDELPADAYAKGFLRTYASYLELDPQQYLAAFRENRREVEERIAPVVERPYEPRRPGTPLFVGLALGLAAVLAVAAWQLDSREKAAPARTEPVSAARTQPAAEPEEAPAPARARPLLLTARDDSWVAVRFRSAKGKLVWAGTLRRGRTLKLGLAKPLWIRAGRPTVLAASVGKRAVVVPDATTFVATPRGLRAV